MGVSFGLQHLHSTLFRTSQRPPRVEPHEILLPSLQVRTWLRTKSMKTLSQLLAGTCTPYVGGLWECPLVYRTSIASSQRVTPQASKSIPKAESPNIALCRCAKSVGCSVLGTSCAKSLMLGIVNIPPSGQPQRVEWMSSAPRWLVKGATRVSN